MKSKLLTPAIQLKVKEVYEQEKSIDRTREKVSQILSISLTRRNVYEILNGVIKDIKDTEKVLQELNDEITSHKPYEISEDGLAYLLTHKGLKKTFRIDISIVDQIFKDFSRHGNNLSGEEILQKYKIKPEVFTLLKNKLRLYKASDVISPFTAETLPEEELEEKIHEAIDDNLSRTKEKMVTTYEKSFKREAKRAMGIVGNFEYRLDMLRKVIEGYKVREIDFIPEKPKNNDEITVLFSDVHIGKKDTHLIKERIYKMTNDILNRRESVVNLIGLGDYVETLAIGGMHPNQIENMVGPFGFDLMMEVVNIIENMLIILYKYGKVVRMASIAGNHDRLSQDNNIDIEKTGGIIIFEMIKRGLQNLNIEIEFFRDEWNNIERNDFNFILNHGTRNNTSMDPKRILWEYGVKGKHNIICFGDKHHSNLVDVADDATKIIVPALAGAGDYDKRLCLSSYSGYVIVEKNDDGLPNTIFRRMK